LPQPHQIIAGGVGDLEDKSARVVASGFGDPALGTRSGNSGRKGKKLDFYVVDAFKKSTLLRKMRGCEGKAKPLLA